MYCCVDPIINFQLLILYTPHSWIFMVVLGIWGTFCSTRYKVCTSMVYGLITFTISSYLCSASFCDPTPKPPIVGQKRYRCGHLILPERHGVQHSRKTRETRFAKINGANGWAPGSPKNVRDSPRRYGHGVDWGWGIWHKKQVNHCRPLGQNIWGMPRSGHKIKPWACSQLGTCEPRHSEWHGVLSSATGDLLLLMVFWRSLDGPCTLHFHCKAGAKAFSQFCISLMSFASSLKEF